LPSFRFEPLGLARPFLVPLHTSHVLVHCGISWLTPPGLQQRNGRKTITTVQGIPDKYDPKKLLKAMKKEFACNGHVVHSADSDDEDSPAPGKKDDHGKVLQFQGDQRVSVKTFLVDSGLLTEKEAKDQIVM
jgi:translation initiation factor 1